MTKAASRGAIRSMMRKADAEKEEKVIDEDKEGS